MFFLSLDFSVILPAALLGTAFVLVLLVAAFFVFGALGFRFYWRKKRAPSRVKAVTASAVKEAPSENDISEEELIVIISAAVEAMGASAKKRFRVVSFKRI